MTWTHTWTQTPIISSFYKRLRSLSAFASFDNEDEKRWIVHYIIKHPNSSGLHCIRWYRFIWSIVELMSLSFVSFILCLFPGALIDISTRNSTINCAVQLTSFHQPPVSQLPCILILRIHLVYFLDWERKLLRHIRFIYVYVVDWFILILRIHLVYFLDWERKLLRHIRFIYVYVVDCC